MAAVVVVVGVCIAHTCSLSAPSSFASSFSWISSNCCSSEFKFFASCSFSAISFIRFTIACARKKRRVGELRPEHNHYSQLIVLLLLTNPE